MYVSLLCQAIDESRYGGGYEACLSPRFFRRLVSYRAIRDQRSTATVQQSVIHDAYLDLFRDPLVL